MLLFGGVKGGCKVGFRTLEHSKRTSVALLPNRIVPGYMALQQDIGRILLSQSQRYVVRTESCGAIRYKRRKWIALD